MDHWMKLLPTAEDWQALGAVATTILALMVFLEARQIRRADWLVRQNQLWTAVNQMVVTHDDATRIGRLMSGKRVAPPLTVKETFLTFQFFDAMSSEYNALKSGLIDTAYVLDSFMDSARVLAPNRDWIVPLARERGYEASFVRVLDILAETVGDRPAMSRRVRAELRRARGLRGAWRR